jgi:hypothetical protein
LFEIKFEREDGINLSEILFYFILSAIYVIQYPDAQKQTLTLLTLSMILRSKATVGIG